MINDKDKIIKDFVLKTNPSKINSNNDTDTFRQFIENFDYLRTKLLLSQSELSDKDRLFLTDTLSIWFLRSAQFIKSKKIDTNAYKGTLKLELLTPKNSDLIFQFIVDFWAETGPALVNALRDLFSKFMTLSKLVQEPQEYQKMCQTWLFHILQIPSTLKVQYYLIEALASDIDLFQIIERKPDFIHKSLSLMNIDSLSTPVGKCTVNLLINIFNVHYNGNIDKIDDWLNIWKATLLEFLDNKKYMKSINIYILEPLLKLLPKEVFQKFVRIGFHESPAQLLSVLRLGQELKIEEEPYKDDKIVTMETVKDLLHTNTYKLQAFELLTYSIKSSKPVDKTIFDIIKTSINAFFLDVEIETRNYFWSTFKHFLYRIRDSTYALNRDAVKLTKAGKFPNEAQEKLNKVSVSEDFLKWFVDLLIFHMIPGSSYQSNHLALKLLMLLLELGLDKNSVGIILPSQDKREFPFHFDIISNKAVFRVLLDNLTSKFPDIRENSRNILLIIINSLESDALQENIDMDDLLEKANLYLQLYQYCDIGASLHEFLFSISFNKRGYVMKMLNQLDNMLMNVDEIDTMYIMQPIGGVFIGLRSVMALHTEQKSEDLKDTLVSQSLDLVMKNWSVMKDIVCHESSDSIVPAKYQNVDIADHIITTQAFRAIKEASELVEVLLLKYHISINQLQSIGQLLIEQLFFIRHSGAFQAVLPAFRICVALCQQDAPDVLKKWLVESLLIIETKTQHITRRSGGIPFIISTIVASERDDDNSNLKFAFDKLISIVNIPLIEFQDELDLPQVNAYNCIKAIFVETKLSRACIPYVTGSLELCLRGFVSEFWAIRNCAMMLFTAIQNRLFGKSGKDYAARLFFTRFQGVRELLLSTLQNATDSIVNDHEVDRNIESLFLIANLVSRLKPTSGFDGLDEFVVLLRKSLVCNNWEVRDLVARAIAKLTINNETDIIKLVDNLKIANQNKLHGDLLLLKYILTEVNESYHVTITPKIVECFIKKLNELMVTNSCWITLKTFCELTVKLFERHSYVAKSYTNVLLKLLGHLYCENVRIYRQDATRQLALAKILSILLKEETRENVQDILLLTLYCDYYECHKVALDHILVDISILEGLEGDFFDICKTLFINQTILPNIRALCLHVLTAVDTLSGKILVIETLKSTNIEALFVKSIELLGNVINKADINELWPTLAKNFADDQIVDIRFASLNCIVHNRDLFSNPNILFQLFLNLEDDDEDIRKKSARHLHINLSKTKNHWVDISPSYVESKFSDILHINEDLKIDFLQLAETKLKKYLSAIPLDLSSENVDNKSMFETEKDNQYCNETIRYINLVYILLKKPEKPLFNSLKVFALMYLENLERHINERQIEDKCLGWLTNPEIFSRMYVLRLMLIKVATGHLQRLDEILQNAKVHPAIFLPTSDWFDKHH
ncbi:hypothetical protein RNJ44_03285 [Nakaseomyces bracarensis]|uniref:DUF2428 domain-containing protein n=1 Tax=Nakaseomyces bracarensis TaxID=273131 RepID=A0ABR4NZB4_9SACH